MARTKKNTQVQAQAFTDEQMTVISGIVAEAVAQALTGLRGKGTSTPTTVKPQTEGLVAFTKANGDVKMVTPAQAQAWNAYRENGKHKDENLAKFAEDRKAYKPSKALVEAIKADRASITRKVAKEQYGFVGTKDDLKALKDSICK